MNVYQLFDSFPREFGLKRRLVKSREELQRLVELYDGVKSVYVSLYSGLVIDKVFFDIDSKDLASAFDDARELIKRIEDCRYPYIPLFSGRKGFHIYIPIRRWRAPNVETARAVLHEFQVKLAEGLKHVDRKVFGDVRRLVRYPNTLNGFSYCVPLPLDFVDWRLEDVIAYAKRKREVEYDIKFLPNIDALVDHVNVPKKYEVDFAPQERWDLPASFKLAANLLRPCVAQLLSVDRDPPHLIRLDLVCELAALGWSAGQIIDVIASLKWRDFDRKKTRYYVNHIVRRGYLPVSCSKLRDYVKCTSCGWFYFWGGRSEVQSWS